MNKRILAIAMIMILVTAGLFAANPTATVELVASIGEVPANTGIRIVEGTGLAGPVDPVTFDPLFFSAPSEIQLATGIDTATVSASGDFTVLVRRPTVSSFTVKVTGAALKLSTGTNYLQYFIRAKNTTTDFVRFNRSTGTPTKVTNDITYTGSSSASEILRNQKTFTYTIPRDQISPLGIYTADITFELTTT